METSRKAQFQRPIETWFAMKDKLKSKYVPSYYYGHLLDKWRRITQATNLPKNMLSNLISFSLPIISYAYRVTSKYFPNLALDLE